MNGNANQETNRIFGTDELRKRLISVKGGVHSRQLQGHNQRKG